MTQRNRKSTGPYEVGYRRPPKSGRFRPGQSGNPKGRARGKKNLGRMLADILDQRITVREGDRIRTMSKSEAILHTLVMKAVKGDAKAYALLIAQAREQGQFKEDPVGRVMRIEFVRSEQA